MKSGWLLSLWALAVVMMIPAVAPAARELTVGVEDIDYSPAYGVRGGRFVGAGGQILDAFAAAKGHRLVYRPLPVKRLLAELIHGGVDLKFPDSPDWQASLRRGQSIAYSKPVFAYIDGTVVLRDNAGMGVDAVRRLGTVAGFTPFAWGERIRAGKVELIENPGFEQLLRQVQTGRIDGAYVNIAVALHWADQVLDSPGLLAFAPALPHIAESYRLSSVSAPEIIAEFDDWLSRNGKLVADIIARAGAERGVR